MPPPANLNSTNRKTLADRAGEVSRPAPMPPGSRPLNSGVKSYGTAAPYHDISFSASTSSFRPSSSTSSRNTSFSSSIGPGGRPPSAYSNRGQAVIGNSRVRKPSQLRRPSTSQDMRQNMNRANQGIGQNTGMLKFSYTPLENIQLGGQESGGCYETRMNRTSSWASRTRPSETVRNFSLSSTFGRLSIHSKSQPTFKAETESLFSPCRIPIQTPQTPSVLFPAESLSPCKSPKRPKALAPFLTRDSNTRAAESEWDSQIRIENVEKMCFKLQGQIGDATSETIDLKNVNSELKARSEFSRF